MNTPTSSAPKTAEVPARQPRPRGRALAVGILVAASGLLSAAGYEAYHASTSSPQLPTTRRQTGQR